MKFLKLFFVLVATLMLNFSSVSAEDNLNIGADIMSRYIFRGVDYGNSASIQPYLSYKTGSFEIGYWGAIATNSSFQEIDLFAKYSIGNFSIILTDYFIPTLDGTNPASSDTRFFTFDDKTTAHTLEGALSYNFGKDFPLTVMAAAFFYGNDKRWGFDAEKDANEDTYFSTYVELAYAFSVSGNNMNLFLGLTPSAGAFGNDFGVVNLGLKGTKAVKITDNFTLPVHSTLIYNPQLSAVNFIFGISL